MKLTAHEEYGFRCLVQLAKHGAGASMTIPEISAGEGISQPYVAKLMRILRRGGFVTSSRGKIGGYMLARPASQIIVGDVLAELGGRLFEGTFCESHSGRANICRHSTDCSIRALWHSVQVALDQVLAKTTLQDLLHTEDKLTGLSGDLQRFGLPGIQ
ncbi:MAG TPA: Rrf2 family transcriptional regulator [Bryobacteraceae bacterium]|nr:Rrf2 family transcriptional regulator [Bryobacteraceae bacterium]